MPTSDDARRIVVAGALFLLLLAVLALPFTSIVHAVTDTFSASVTVTNSPPVVYFVDPSQSLTGAAGTTAVVYVLFNASDANGYTDVNVTSALVRIQNGTTERNSSSCVLFSGAGQNARIHCSITIYYYDAPGTWVINASVKDNSTNFAQNTSQTLTVNNIDSIDLISASISFSGAPGVTDIASSPTAQVTNNTGNQNYTSINVTGYAFTSGALTINVGNVTANTSNSGGPGHVLVNNTEVTLASSGLARGVTATRDLYFWLDIPAGQTSGSYSAQSSWIVEANQ